MSASMTRPTPKKSRKQHPPSQTKFDVWLESHLTEGETVAFLFRDHPFDSDAEGKFGALCNILTVDRYMLYLEISLGEDHIPVWVAKDNIISAQ